MALQLYTCPTPLWCVHWIDDYNGRTRTFGIANVKVRHLTRFDGLINWKGFGRKRSWPNLKILSRNLTGGTEENDENPQDIWRLDRELNPGCPEYGAGVLATRLRRSDTLDPILSLLVCPLCILTACLPNIKMAHLNACYTLIFFQ
jgi:hypothetical protein